MFFTKRNPNHLCNVQVENLHPKAMEMLLCVGMMSPPIPRTHGGAAPHGQISPFPSPWDRFPEQKGSNSFWDGPSQQSGRWISIRHL